MAVAAHLEPGERPVTLFTALTPPPESDGMLIDGVLVPLAWAVRHATWRHTTRAASRSADTPLAPRMIVALTARRMVIWRATRRWRLGRVIGDLPRDRISGVTARTSGTRSSTLVLHLSTGPTVTIMVTSDSADQLAALLSVHPDSGPIPARPPEAGLPILNTQVLPAANHPD
jgi:hypothetical protein